MGILSIQSCPTLGNYMGQAITSDSHMECQRNEGKLDIVKGEMIRLEIDLLGVSGLHW